MGNERVSFALYSNSHRAIRNAMAMARSEPEIAIAPSDLDCDQFALNVANGTIDLRTGTLHEHRKSDYITKQSLVAFDPQADCPRWDAFLATTFGGDHELISFVQRLAGYCLTGDVSEQILAIFYGTGSNGKSTFLNVLLDVMGDYAAKASEGLLLEGRGDSHPTGLADLAGKRLAVASETKDDAHMAEARVKELTGGEKVRARRMREDFWEFAPTHKIIIATNHKPQVKGTDHAIWRRIRLIPFNVTIRDSEQDKQLPEKLRAEYAGILGWMVAGCQAWQAIGLKSPRQVEAATAGYRAAEDGLGSFLAECCDVRPDASASASELLDAYQQFGCDRKMTARKLAGLLTDRGFTSARGTQGPTRGRVAWHGLALSDHE